MDTWEAHFRQKSRRRASRDRLRQGAQVALGAAALLISIAAVIWLLQQA